ncbi:aromatic prenyltransferase [Xylaria sp. FL0064]|nr:aromatic prenyltransferase [Xylaria sp. FL0064]
MDDKNPARKVCEPSPMRTPAFQRVDSEGNSTLDRNGMYWWRSSGHALAVLLSQAGYSTERQYRLLNFFREIVPSLGSDFESQTRQWKSFMTDDHNPIELSWDWSTGGKPPKIRFSIEPVGVHAGTLDDPDNVYAAAQLLEKLNRLLPSVNMTLLSHFKKHLIDPPRATGPVGGHLSKEFYAFDLGENEIMSKAYLFPGFKAQKAERGSFDLISDAIQTMPNITQEKLQAFEIIRDYVYDSTSSAKEIELMALDLLDLEKSRFKIYFRIRNASFESVKHTMTLGNRIALPGMDEGLKQLRQLHSALLGRNESMTADNTQLPFSDHRTGGILYNAEFTVGSLTPKVKAYLPVRHYGKSEEAVISALKSLDRQNLARIDNYRAAIRSIFSHNALRVCSGVHTYIGCSMEASAELRIVSYINPRRSQFRMPCLD